MPAGYPPRASNDTFALQDGTAALLPNGVLQVQRHGQPGLPNTYAAASLAVEPLYEGAVQLRLKGYGSAIPLAFTSPEECRRFQAALASAAQRVAGPPPSLQQAPSPYAAPATHRDPHAEPGDAAVQGQGSGHRDWVRSGLRVGAKSIRSGVKGLGNMVGLRTPSSHSLEAPPPPPPSAPTEAPPPAPVLPVPPAAPLEEPQGPPPAPSAPAMPADMMEGMHVGGAPPSPYPTAEQHDEQHAARLQQLQTQRMRLEAQLQAEQQLESSLREQQFQQQQHNQLLQLQQQQQQQQQQRAADPPTTPTEAELENYVQGRNLGAGGQGSLVLGHTADGSKTFVIKKIPCESIDESDQVYIRAVMLSMTLAENPHRGIIKYLKVEQRRGDPSVVILMPCYTEGDLEGVLRGEARLPPPRVASYVMQIADALEYLHGLTTERNGRQVHMVHRDLKPANILLSEGKARCTLIDFDSWGRTGQSSCAATAEYAAPELAARNEATPKSDVWSLGALLFALMAWTEPMACDPADGQLTLLNHPTFAHPDTLRHAVLDAVAEPFRTGAGRGLADLCVDMLSADLARRPTAKAVMTRCEAMFPEVVRR
eukprot:TRINITY_DN387_c0_g2_i1.p1 TRINITY_DN387_c0_g2~~TRINITY_DN387_c0_g2_i1.p1  ORF type:complete len:596 (+),score=206.16 TRINITY_DN387_c0_g2_i1:147-1934(+)